MPVKAPSTCNVPGCPELTQGTRCVVHSKRTPAFNADLQRRYRNPAKQAVYRSPRWRGVRRTQLQRAPWCAMLDCTNAANEVDHIIDFADERDPLCWAPENLQSLCKRCHSRKTAREVFGRK